MAYYRAQARLAAGTGLPEDTVMNTFHFMTDNPVDGAVDGDAIRDKLSEFYATFANYMSGSHFTGNGEVEVFNMSDPMPRVPIFEGPFTFSPAASGNTIPTEVAACLSYHGTYSSGQPNARRRGRIFVGPLAAAAVQSASGRVTLASAFITALAAGGTLLAGAFGTNGLKWSVYSPTIDAGSTLDFAYSEIIGGWVDNAFDTQRRRGTKATTRTLWAA